MEIKIEDILFSVTETQEVKGDSMIYDIPRKLYMEFLEFYYDIDLEEPIEDQIVDLPPEITEDQENDFSKDKFTISSPDTLVVFLAFLFEEADVQETIHYEGELFWLIHDYMHSKYDVYGGTVQVDDHSENVRHFQALDYMKEHGLLDYVDNAIELRDSIEEMFLSRGYKEFKPWEFNKYFNGTKHYPNVCGYCNRYCDEDEIHEYSEEFIGLVTCVECVDDEEE